MGLDALRQKILLMASRAETAVNQSVQSLVQRESPSHSVGGIDEFIMAQINRPAHA